VYPRGRTSRQYRAVIAVPAMMVTMASVRWRRRWILMGFGLLVTACGSSQTVLGPARPSEVGGLPVPANAQLLPNGSANSAMYEAPQGVSREALTSWYLRNAPIGRSIGDWQPCQTRSGSQPTSFVGGSAWTWFRNGQLLMASVSDVSTPSGEHASVILSVSPLPPGVTCT
jgi:hypothetical protein